jgi:peptide/nickel transport system substrate-binding protein
MVILTLLAAGLAACGSAEAPASTEPPVEKATEPPTEETTEPPTEEPTQAEPSTLRVGVTNIWDTANPAFAWSGYDIRFLLYDTLSEWAHLDTFEPGLAESWSVSDDGLVWTFNIREGVTFHDGTPCTAEDVAWGLNWIIENDIESMAFFLEDFEEVVALDPTTLQVTLSAPVANMISALLIYTYILPRSVWEDIPEEELMEFEDLEAGIGTGPYKLVEWVEDEYLIVEANEDYWRGRPPIDRIIWQQYATDDALVQAILAGEVDVIGVPSTAVQTLQEVENIEVSIGPTLAIFMLIINSHEEGSQPDNLNDPAVRLAIDHAIDKQQIINVAYLGYAEPATAFLPPAMGDFHNSDIEGTPFDPDEGNRILEEAGYVDGDGDGIREDADGNPLEYRLYTIEGAENARVLEIISDNLAQIGISAPPTVMDEDSLIALYPDYDFDMIYWDWGLDPDPKFAMNLFTCGERVEGGWNDSGYCDPEYDEKYYEQGAIVDREARRQLLWEMQEELFEKRPYIVLAYPLGIEAYRNDRFILNNECGGVITKWCLLQAEVVQ